MVSNSFGVEVETAAAASEDFPFPGTVRLQHLKLLCHLLRLLVLPAGKTAYVEAREQIGHSNKWWFIQGDHHEIMST